ncbi:LPXTG cell wall anchor domain-containing protein, partial [Acaricomes phytoseiuli]|uniref:LPXTG cell wall anchor domain-containing protein n=1 Tax=Acaricomes phytoseiuli TaxID=291968 RepID=UPI0022218E16
SNGDGTYTATVVSTVAGSKAVTVSFDGAAIRADKNTDAVFVAGAVDPVPPVEPPANKDTGDLAVTGAAILPFLLIGGLILGIGSTFLVVTRRKRKQEEEQQ